MHMKLSWKGKLIHTISTIDQLMSDLKLSYENCIKGERALINTNENEQSHVLPLNVPRTPREEHAQNCTEIEVGREQSL